jgi:tRNA U34 2-thiouridine synthase MnmA/TrmU
MKAVALFSGGLDSLLAIRLVQEQGIDVTALCFCSPFFIDDEKKKKLGRIADKYRFRIEFIDLGNDYIKLVRNPKHGHGKNMNPCIDCHAFMLRKAKEYAEQIHAKFIFTGEVLDERPMSQNRKSLDIVEHESGLKGKLLRPLSAKLLPKTEAENQWIDRNKLLNISGRGRKPQLALAKRFKIDDYETPGGGCLLTYEEYSKKLRDLFAHKKRIDKNDLLLLKFGRHFRLGNSRIIVGRNEDDNNNLVKLKHEADLMFEARDFVGPTTLLIGKPDKNLIELAAKLTARYSDADKDEVVIRYGNQKLNKELAVSKTKNEEIENFRVR